MSETCQKSAWSRVAWLWKKSTRNLVILSWFGVACQVAGVVGFLVSMLVKSEASIVPALLIILGIAVAGWAGNLKEITELKSRISQLESGATQSTGNAHHG